MLCSYTYMAILAYMKNTATTAQKINYYLLDALTITMLSILTDQAMEATDSFHKDKTNDVNRGQMIATRTALANMIGVIMGNSDSRNALMIEVEVYAWVAEMWGQGGFHSTLATMTTTDARDALIDLFEIVEEKLDRDGFGY